MAKRHNGISSASGTGRRRHGGDTISRHRRRICWRTGKRRLRDSHQAAQALEGSRRRGAYELAHFGDTARHELRSYRCEHCGGHHLTSEERRAHRRGTESTSRALPIDELGRRRLAVIARVAAASAA